LQDFIDSEFLPDDVLEEGSLTILQLLELLVTRSHLVQYLIAQHTMICMYNLIMVYAFGTTLGKFCTGESSASCAV
jgi:ABC-type proline/glycine betaine transport system permease subunit